MKLHFEPNLPHQHTAIESVCDMFRGQEICRTEFTVTRDALAAQLTLAFAQSDLGIGNRLQLLDDELLANLGDIQIRNGLRPRWPQAISPRFVQCRTHLCRATGKERGRESLCQAPRLVQSPDAVRHLQSRLGRVG